MAYWDDLKLPASVTKLLHLTISIGYKMISSAFVASSLINLYISFYLQIFKFRVIFVEANSHVVFSFIIQFYEVSTYAFTINLLFGSICFRKPKPFFTLFPNYKITSFAPLYDPLLFIPIDWYNLVISKGILSECRI